ncbi:uncharacterized protein LOC116831781 [Chelonoidis abingdonii]|uniref:uncharacterized protein LOC116831781 n=1 Tax=Chelonoidis abingdonii TaxID=106734 RepID=UPI003F4978FF
MEMGTSWRVWLMLLLFYKAGAGRAEAGAMELSRILGGSITFLLDFPAEQVKSVVWTVNTTRSIVTVGAGNPPNVIVSDPSYEGRLRFPAESNSLQITSLRMGDMGTYRAQITTATGTIHRPFLLRVYKQVPEPAVLCDSGTCVNETCNYNLSCTVRDGGDNVTYSWTHTAGGAVVPNGSILHISLSPHDAHLNVTCTAQNPASNSTTTASAKGLCAAPTTATTTVNSSQFQSASTAGIAVPIVIGIIIVVVIALCYVHRQKHKKGKLLHCNEHGSETTQISLKHSRERRLHVLSICVKLPYRTDEGTQGGVPSPMSRVQCLPVPSLHWQWGLFHSLTSHVLFIAEADAEKNTVYAQVGNLPLPCSRTGTPKGGLKTKEDETKTIYATVQNPNQSPLQTDDEKLGKDGLESMKNGKKTIYATVNEPTQTKTTKSTDADDSAATPKPQRTTEYDKII